ncbi:MAG: hypothetical protein L3K08_01895 [Thermoplasmata archaeon]|nr:hypothetical protein [Thermoplasmata archaeon]
MAILIGLFGLFLFLGGLLLVVFGTGIAYGAGTVTLFGSGSTVAGLVVLLVGLIILVVATGLWDQELWALALAIIVLLFYGLVTFLSQAWLDFLVVGGLVVYLIAVSGHFD